jgi:hypothetical protein
MRHRVTFNNQGVLIVHEFFFLLLQPRDLVALAESTGIAATRKAARPDRTARPGSQQIDLPALLHIDFAIYRGVVDTLLNTTSIAIAFLPDSQLRASGARIRVHFLRCRSDDFSS